jgi:DNA-binding transcriptional regulator YdaS (Cro superfamily)
MKTLRQYIDENFGGNQRAFADAQGVKPPQVTQWINKNFVVVGDDLYSFRRHLVKKNISGERQV